MKSNLLLYAVEGVVPILTALFVWAGVLALKQEKEKHKKIAGAHAVSTWVASAAVVVLVRLGYTMGGGAPEWIMNIHLAIIYLIPPWLVLLAITGLAGKRGAHMPLAGVYSVLWTAALVTGAMIFAMDRGWM
ncbi:MAG: hypothetical protein ACNS63_05785 [Candidatus Nitrospinota bacterium M3_3B_026]